MLCSSTSLPPAIGDRRQGPPRNCSMRTCFGGGSLPTRAGSCSLATRWKCQASNRHPYAVAIVVIAPFDPRYLSAPSSTYNIPPPAGFTDGTTEALPIAITPCPAPNWLVSPETDVATGCPPLKNNYRFEASIIRVAAIYLELVRLNRNFVFPCGSHLTSLDKFDVGIGVVNPYRSCTSMFTCLFDTQSGLVVCRVCGSHLQNSRRRGEGTLI
jgi:hypothetical protein